MCSASRMKDELHPAISAGRGGGGGTILGRMRYSRGGLCSLFYISGVMRN